MCLNIYILQERKSYYIEFDKRLVFTRQSAESVVESDGVRSELDELLDIIEGESRDMNVLESVPPATSDDVGLDIVLYTGVVSALEVVVLGFHLELQVLTVPVVHLFLPDVGHVLYLYIVQLVVTVLLFG